MDRCRQFKFESSLLVCVTLSRSGWLCIGLLWLSGSAGNTGGKHLAESKLKLFCLCVNKRREKAEKSSAHLGSVGCPACILLLSPLPTCSCLGCAASLEPTAVSLLNEAKGGFVSFLSRRLSITPNVFFLFSLLKRNS